MTDDFVGRAGALRGLVEDGLAALFTPQGLVTDSGIPPDLAETMRYALLGGGKRMRPVLCLAVCQAVCGDPAPALPAALAVEVFHNYTLIHDDLPCMDDDDERRGRPTVHRKFGFAQAVLAGDALQACAFSLALMAPAGCAARLARAAGPAGVVGGQWADVAASPSLDAGLVSYVHEHKTADLVECACAMGAICGGPDGPSAVETAAEFGRELGLAFQIVDDLLDAGDPRKAGELSILRVAGRDEAASLAKAATGRALEALDRLAPDGGAGRNEAPDVSASRASAAETMRRLVMAQLDRTL